MVVIGDFGTTTATTTATTAITNTTITSIITTATVAATGTTNTTTECINAWLPMFTYVHIRNLWVVSSMCVRLPYFTTILCLSVGEQTWTKASLE